MLLTLPNQMTSVLLESNSRRICHSTSTSALLVLSAFNYDNLAASNVLWMTTLSLHSFMRSSRAESIMTGAPKKTTDKLQRVLNSAARIVSNTRKFDCGHLDFPRVKLASYGGRSFAYAGHSNWNSVPAYLRDSSLSLSSFKHHLKTFLFSFY